MKKSELKQLIKECIREITENQFARNNPNTAVAPTFSGHDADAQGWKQDARAEAPNLDVKQIADIEVDGVDSSDYPDFADAYVSAAVYPDGKGGYRDLTEDELEWLNNEYPEIANEKAHESMQGAGDSYERDR